MGLCRCDSLTFLHMKLQLSAFFCMPEMCSDSVMQQAQTTHVAEQV